MREEEVAAKSRSIQVTILPWQWTPAEHFCGTCKGQKIEEHVFPDLDVRNDESRPSLTSRAVAEERQEVSSKNTIDELVDAITGSKNIGLWSSNVPEKMREHWLKNEKLF